MPWVFGFALSASFLQRIQQTENIQPDDSISPLDWAMKQARALLPTRMRDLTQCEGDDGKIVTVIYFYKAYDKEPPQLDGTDGCPTDEEMEPLRTRFGIREQWYYKTNNAFHDKPPRPVVFVEALTQDAKAKEMLRQRMEGMKIEEEREDGYTSALVAG